MELHSDSDFSNKDEEEHKHAKVDEEQKNVWLDEFDDEHARLDEDYENTHARDDEDIERTLARGEDDSMRWLIKYYNNEIDLRMFDPPQAQRRRKHLSFDFPPYL